MRYGILLDRNDSTPSLYVADVLFDFNPSYSGIQPMYYRNAQAAVVVYDVTKSTSLDKAKTWVKELQRQANPNIVIALAGNKVDLVQPTSGSSISATPDSEDEADDATATPGEPAAEGETESLRQVPREEAEAYAQEAGLLFFETSAKTGDGIVEIFTEIGAWRTACHLLHTELLCSQEDSYRADTRLLSRRSRSSRCCWRSCRYDSARGWG